MFILILRLFLTLIMLINVHDKRGSSYWNYFHAINVQLSASDGPVMTILAARYYIRCKDRLNEHD